MRKKILSLSAAALLAVSSAASSQTFGQLTSAVASGEGEGGLFILAGDEIFRAGTMARFGINSKSDFGVQFGLNREEGASSPGGGIDFKLNVIEDIPNTTIDAAVDLSFGRLDTHIFRCYLVGAGIIVSGEVPSSGRRTIEPYSSLFVFLDHRERKDPQPVGGCVPCGGGDACEDGNCNEIEVVLRLGMKVPLTDEIQAFTEISLGEDFLVGAAINLIF